MRAAIPAGHDPARCTAYLVSQPSSRALHSRVTCCFIVACLLLFSCAATRAAASMPAPFPAGARIIYTAGTLGYLHPCATCAGSAQGGLARRAHLLPQLAAERPRSLVLAGPGEFYADRDPTASAGGDTLATVLHAAFSAMPYAGVYLSPEAADGMKRLGLTPLPKGVPVTDSPAIHYYRTGPYTAGCVFLPPGGGDKGAPTREQVRSAQNAAREAGTRARLVIGISPWGMEAENALMSEFAGHFHVILGGGPGIAIPGQAMNSGTGTGPLWVRSDRRGRAVNVLDIHSLPETPSSPWLEGINFSSRLVFLEKNLPEDEEVKTIIRAVPYNKD